MRCSTCRHYRPPVRAKRGLCLVYELRGAGPRVMPTFGCTHHVHGCDVSLDDLDKMVEILDDAGGAAHRALTAARKRARMVRAFASAARRKSEEE